MQIIHADSVTVEMPHIRWPSFGDKLDLIERGAMTATAETVIPIELANEHRVAIRHVMKRGPYSQARGLIAFDAQQTSLSIESGAIRATYQSIGEVIAIAPFEGDDIEGAVAAARQAIELKRQELEMLRAQDQAERVRRELAAQAERRAAIALELALRGDPFDLDSDRPAQPVMCADDESDEYDDWWDD